MGANKFSPMEIDAIGEIMNISLGASATAASTMLDARVDITTPKVRVQRREEFSFTNLEPAICVEITYVEGLTGDNVMLLKRNDVRAIVGMLMGMEIPDEEFELNEMNISAICEVMNQMMGASATALSELLSRTVNISTPRSFEVHSDEMFKDKYFPKEQPAMVVISFQLDIAGQLSSEFMNLMPINLAKELVHGFFPDLADMEEEEEEETMAEMEQQPAASGGSSEKMSQEQMDALFASMQGGDTAPAAPQPTPAPTGGSSEKMSQEQMDALFASMQGGDTTPAAEVVSTPQPVVEQPIVQQPVMQQPVQTVEAAPAAMVQPGQMMGVQPMMPSAEAMALSQSILEMQKMQMKMLEQMQQMEKERQQAQEAPKQKESAQPRQLKVRPGIQKSLHDASAGEIDPDGNLDMIMGVPVEVAVEIGRTRKLVKDILELNKGSLVVLDKLAGEQVDLFANGQCIAKGDVVVVDDNFGIRITQILAENLPGVE